MIDARSVGPNDLIGGRYLIQREIGRGGYGCVFAARHTGTGQEVALKVISQRGEADDVVVRRFFQEARVTSGLKHPNTIRVFDFGQDDSGLFYLAMELLVGRTLKEEIKRRAAEGRGFSEAEAVRIGVGVARSLTEAHRAGLVHRDLKPDNIFLHEVDDDEPIVKVLDFGIVKLADSTLTMGSDSGTPGTPAYMSPEQVERGELDGRSDLYSLGVVLYQLVAGRAPFVGGGIAQVLYRHVHEAPVPLAEAASGPVSRELAEIVDQCLEKTKERRPRDARALRRLLEGWHPNPLAPAASVSLESRPFSSDPAISTRPIPDDEAAGALRAGDGSRKRLVAGLSLVGFAIVVGTAIGAGLAARERPQPILVPPPPITALPPAPTPPPVAQPPATKPPAEAPPKEKTKRPRKRPSELDVLHEKI